LNSAELAYLEGISTNTAEEEVSEDGDYQNEESFAMPPAGRTSDGGILIAQW
jgi:hypothetical protein